MVIRVDDKTPGNNMAALYVPQAVFYLGQTHGTHQKEYHG
ncbi:Hypothetical protein I595_3279 [Croceitalea dokdonensis DOKDO 023]|uniref:Uncharacterized protein n=1 Tax=Croceitalea dokdonensis DOKDO 023 TaxID=1300341 RepID=A0A0P7AS68_9FLAO|nr:Hypothetical protein I595_3279 [Croceitalea dokdonensis DOKDO 023]